MSGLQRRRLLTISLTVLFLLLLIGGASVLYYSPWSGSEAKLEIRVKQRGIALPDGFFLYQQLTAQGITIKSITPDNETLIIHFNSTEESEAAQKILQPILSNAYSIR